MAPSCAESVDSVLVQEGGEPRVIVIDDGSTDAHTLAELDRLPPRVELVRQANTGPAVARNVALGRAHTRYALVLDADDRLAASALRRLRAPLDADPTLGFSYGIVRFFGEWQGILRMPPHDPYRLFFATTSAPPLSYAKSCSRTSAAMTTFHGYEDGSSVHALERGLAWAAGRSCDPPHRRHGHPAS